MIPLKRYIPYSLAFIFGVIYLLTPTALYYWDGIVFAHLCEEGAPIDLIHPHHLMYNQVLDIIYEGIRLHFPPVRALSFLIWCSSIFGALTIYFSHLIFRTVFKREGLAVATTCFMGFSFTFWHFSTDASAYIISAFFPILATYLLFSVNETPKFRIRLVWAAITFAIGMLLHQVVVFYYLVYTYWTICFHFRDPGKSISPASRLFLVILPGFIVASAYFLIGRIYFGYNSFEDYWAWMTAYGHQDRWWYSTENSSPMAFIQAVGLSHLKLMFYPDYIRYGLFNFENPSLLDTFKKVIAAIAIIAKFVIIIRGIIYLIGAINRRRFYAWLLVLWILPYFVFFVFFTPQFEFYRLYYLFPLMFIFALGLKGFFEKPLFEHLDLPIRPNSVSGWVFVILIIFALHNYALGIRPQMDVRNNPWLIQARKFIAETPPDAIMVVPWSDSEMEEYSRVANLVEYFGTQGVLFSERIFPFVGPVPVDDFVGPPMPEPLKPELPRWGDFEVRKGLTAEIANIYIHEDMMIGTENAWRVFRYRFPSEKLYIRDSLHLPHASDELMVTIGDTSYSQGKRFYVIPLKPEDY